MTVAALFPLAGSGCCVNAGQYAVIQPIIIASALNEVRELGLQASALPRLDELLIGHRPCGGSV